MPSRCALAAFLVLVLLVPVLAVLPPRTAERHPLVSKSGAPLRLHWTRELPPQKPTWPDQPRYSSDAAPTPVAAGDLVLVTSSRHDSLIAYEAATGVERWQFLAEGPVRIAPAVWRHRVFVACDDGRLHCLDLDTGELLWKVRGGPSDRRVLGNDRLISTWPARGGPVVVEEADHKATVYFAAGVWPFMGIFLHALDAETGEVRWTNSGDGSIYIKQPHQADAFAGVAPQGNLVVAGQRLFVPGGRSVPACYDRNTGKLLHFRLADNSKLGGGPDILVGGGVFINGNGAFDQVTGRYLGPVGTPSVLREEVLYCVEGTRLVAYDLAHRPQATQSKMRGPADWLPAPLGQLTIPRPGVLAVSRGSLYLGTPGQVLTIELDANRAPTRIVDRTAIVGTPARMTAADGRVFVATLEGPVHALGSGIARRQWHSLEKPSPQGADQWTGTAARLLENVKGREGYAVVWGGRSQAAATGRLAEELGRQSDLRLISVEPDPDTVERLRRHFLERGMAGERQTVIVGDLTTAQLPPYLCRLMTTEALPDEVPSVELLRTVFRSLHPYGGVACLPLAPKHRPVVVRLVSSDPILAAARVRDAGPWLLLSREGGLPGAGQWTHEHADAANTRVSHDQLVKAPLGLLWFGGPGNQPILPRHGHGPQPQVIDGRLFLEGVDCLRCLDIYTGRLLWQVELPGLGKAYDNMAHQTGANANGTNYISTRDAIYVAHRNACLLLDPATGKTLRQFRLPLLPGEKEPPEWNYLSAIGDDLVAGCNPRSTDTKPKRPGSTPKAIPSSRYLAILDRHTGVVRRVVEARVRGNGFRHNAICAGNGRLFAIERPAEDQPQRLPKHTNPSSGSEARLIRVDLKSGGEVWSVHQEVFGTWLSYSEKYDILLESGRTARDSLWDEPRGMRAYQGERGKVLWFRKDYLGPAMIHGDWVLKNNDPSAGSGSACDLKTGAPIRRTDPLTGKLIDWSWVRTYGCNTPMASEHLLTFRSGAAGYFDLSGDGGTGNLGGFRSGCTNNLVVAGGVLAAPDYTRSCTCSYQLQTSLALVHDPEVEMWTYFGSRLIPGVVRDVGIKLGAPGGRKADDGTMWLEYPPVGGPSPRLPVRTTPAQPERFRFHSSLVEGSGPRWLTASGLKGLTALTIQLAGTETKERSYVVRLHFLEPDGLPAGRRRFSVSLQGKEVLHDLDISAEAGGPGRPLVKEIKGVLVGKELSVKLSPEGSSAGPVLCGVEVHADGW
jgi:outer membrane protein assembly factor BamB